MAKRIIAAADAKDEDKSLEGLSYPELKKLAAEMGIPANGKKEELIERIRNAGDKQDEEETEADAEEEHEAEEDELPNTGMPE